VPPEQLSRLKKQLYDFIGWFDFPHDGEAVRERFTFCFDYKYKSNTSRGIWLEKEHYDKYWGYRKPWFYILVWAADRQKRFIHQLRDPTEYEVERVQTRSDSADKIAYYKIPDEDWWEPDNALDKLFMVPENLSDIDSLAFQSAVNRWAESGHKGLPTITDKDRVEALKILESPKRGTLRILRSAAKLRRPREKKIGL